MKHINNFEEFLFEGKEMPKQYTGNDGIIYLRTNKSRSSRVANYELYYKGYQIGSFNFASKKHLEDFAEDYIVSNQLYKKLRYEEEKPLPVYERVSKRELDKVEDYLDDLFRNLNIDIEFTEHFYDRLNDRRNGTDITTDELIDVFNRTYKMHGKKIAGFNDNMNALIKDFNTNINIPFTIQVDKDGGLEMISKTIMRKKDFKSNDRKLKIS